MTTNLSTTEAQANERSLWIKGRPAPVDLSASVLNQVTVVQQSVLSLHTEVASLNTSTAIQFKQLQDAIRIIPRVPELVLTESLMPMARLLLQAQVLALDATPEGVVRRKGVARVAEENADDAAIDKLRQVAGKHIEALGDDALQGRCHNALLPFKSPAPAVRLQRFLDIQKLLNDLAVHFARADASTEAKPSDDGTEASNA